jgi:two-component sensor histidine kinase
MQMATQKGFGDEVRLLSDLGGPQPAEELFLVQELTHRFNNDMASLTGFVSLAAVRSGGEEAKLALAGVLQRIYDIASVQRALRVPSGRSIDCARYLAELCRAISAAKLQYGDIELEFLESPLTLDSLDCWRVGMIVSELVSNAARHAFGDLGGKIQVAMTERGCWMDFSVADNGRGLEDFSEGQGTKIVRHLAGLLKGTVERRSTPVGTIARLSFPLAEDSTAAKPIAVFSKKRSRRFQDGDLESEETKSFAANRAVLQRSHKLNNPKEQK